MKYSIRNLGAYVFANLYIFLGEVRKAKNATLDGDHILSIYFHNPSKEEFEFAVRWLKKKGFCFISVSDLKSIIRGELPFPKGAVFVSVDDGWASNVPNVVEIADKEHVPITIFVSTEAIEEGNYWFSYARRAQQEGMGTPSLKEMKRLSNHERLSVLSLIKDKIKLPREAMTVEDIKSIASSQWVTIGGHSHSHPILIKCTDEDLINEITYSKAKIEGWLQKAVDTFAYPNGDFAQREIDALKSEGYILGFANNPDYLTRSSLLEPYKIPRFGFLEGASKAENICRMTGVWKKLRNG